MTDFSKDNHPNQLPAFNGTVPELVLSSLRGKMFLKQIKDSQGTSLSNFQFLVRAHLLANKLRNRDVQTHIGIVLPAAIPSVLAGVAIMFMDKIPVYLNFTSSSESVGSAIEQCSIQTILTSKVFIKKAKLEDRKEYVYLEDVFKSINALDKIAALFDALTMTTSRAKKRLFSTLSASMNNTITVLFSSGSTGIPKGIELSHTNIISNLSALAGVLDINNDDVIVGYLPFFHAFGFCGHFLMPLFKGSGVVYHPNPVESRKIGELIAKHQCTVLFATPSFLNGYIKKCNADQLRSLRLVIAGAEKLQLTTAKKFQKKFDLTPIEGFGATELSPVATVNISDCKEDLGKRCGKLGSVGKAIPGISIKIVHPETKEELDINEEGLMLVQGSNVMKGYLGNPELTNKVIVDGWYNTGDIAKIDDDGFVFVTGRYSRFSKIAGEMVPHTGVENIIIEIVNSDEVMLVVTAIPDIAKGEKLIVIHTKLKIEASKIVSELRNRGLPNLWIPKATDFYEVETVPLLGSGKIDLSRLNALAKELTTN